MTINEAVELLKEGKFTEKELLEYYGIKSLASLEPALELKFDKESFNEKFITPSFEFIYEVRRQEKYNPLEEKYRFYSMVLPGIFGIYAEEVQLLSVVLGLFQTMMILEKLLENKPSVIYYNKLYKDYVTSQNSVEKYMKILFADLNKTLGNFLNENTVEKLQELAKDFTNKVNQIKP